MSQVPPFCYLINKDKRINLMTRQLEVVYEERRARRNKEIIAAVEFDLKAAVEHAGAEYLGFAFRDNAGGGLMTIKGVIAGRRQVAFVGSEDLGSTLIKAVREARGDKLRWREDKYDPEG